MKDKNTFNILMKISLGLYVLILFFAIMLKAIMPKDLIANYQFLSFMNVNERLIRGLKIVEFYQIEAEIGELTKAIILDFFNMIMCRGLIITREIQVNIWYFFSFKS